MNQPHPLRLSSWARLVALSLLLVCGLVAGRLLDGSRAPVQAASRISDCQDESQLQSAVRTASSGETITFGCSGTISLSQTLAIAVNLTLDGSGQSVTLDGHNQVQVLSVNRGVSFTLNALTIAHGQADFGGGLENWGTVNISHSTFASNRAFDGGGLYNSGGRVSISSSTFTSNSARVGGGGLANTGTLSISSSTFASNDGSQGGGGGLYNSGTLSISNSTFASNHISSQASGGGLANTGTVNISHSTFASNRAGFGGRGGGLANAGTLSISSSIVATNRGGNCNGAVSSQGYNLSSDTSCSLTARGDLQNSDPKLGPLANNGGPTPTLALLVGSPALDAAGSNCPATDQRGVRRPQGQVCDIGAFEARPSELITSLINLVNSFHLTKSLQTTLDNKLQDVLTAITGGQTATACTDLSDFIGQAQAQSGKGLTTSQATQLMAAAKQVQAVLGC